MYSEGVFGLSSLVTVYHDYVLTSDGSVMKSFHTAADGLKVRKFGVFGVRMFLTILGQMEVALEIFGEQRAGDEVGDAFGKWFFIRVIETIKAALRLWLLSNIWNKEGALLRTGGIYTSPDAALPVGEDGEPQQNPMDSIMGAFTGDSSAPPPVNVYGRNSGRRLQLPPTRRVMQGVGDKKHGGSSSAGLMGMLQNFVDMRLTGEVLHIIRPVVHVYSVKQWGVLSWRSVLLFQKIFPLATFSASLISFFFRRPWLLSLATDLLSRASTNMIAAKQFYVFQANPDR